MPGSHPGWYRGDFHAHTAYSDGVLSPRELLDVARAEGLDFLAITDHNGIAALSDLPVDPGLLVIPGVEVSLVEGHFNVFGLRGWSGWMDFFETHPYRARLPDAHPTTTALMGHLADEGLLVSINHPLLEPWEWRDHATSLAHVHCLEVWNDPSWPTNASANPAAVTLWTRLLNAGYRITALGGSDYHRPAPPPGQDKPAERLGVPSTYVQPRERSVEGILEAVRARRVYVSMGPRVAFVARAGETLAGIGDDLGAVSGEIRLTAEVFDNPGPARARILKNGLTIAEAPVETERMAFEVSDLPEPGLPTWYRLDVVDDQGQMLAITNPVYTGPRRKPIEMTFGDFARLTSGGG